MAVLGWALWRCPGGDGWKADGGSEPTPALSGDAAPTEVDGEALWGVGWGWRAAKMSVGCAC